MGVSPSRTRVHLRRLCGVVADDADLHVVRRGAARGHGVRSRRRRGARGSRRIRLHPSALPPSDRAGARHGRSRSLAWGPSSSGSGAPIRSFPVPDWMLDTTTILGANIPNDRFVEIAVAVIVLVGLVSFLRFTRVGLIIRAGVENRAMVTALGIDVRKAFTLVFALGGALAALAGVLSIYFGSVDPEGDVAPHLRVHRRRHRGVRVDRGPRRSRRSWSGSSSSTRTTTSPTGSTERRGRRLGDVAARDGPAAQARGPRAEGGALMKARGVVLRYAVPAAVLALLVVVPFLSFGLPRASGRLRLTRHAPVARALSRLRRGRALVRPPVRLHGAPLVRARPLLRARRLRARDRAHGGGLPQRSRCSPSSPSPCRSCSAP